MNRAARILVVVVLLSVLYATLAYAIYMGLTQYALGANDFYSRWAGARALFLRGENPYSAQVTREIQIGMYGRLARSDEDQVAFAYPLYTAFVAAPLVALPYAQAQALWMAFLIVAVTGGVIVLARLNDLALQPVVLGILLLGVIAFYPAVRGIFLGQFALVSFLCLALAFWAIQTRRDALAGVLLALATVKPQLAILLLPAIVVWAAAQRRGKIAGGAALTLFVLSTLALLIVPTWPFDFVQAIRDYSRYEPVGPPVQTFVEMLAGGSGFGVTLAIGLSLVAWAIWRTLQTRHASWQEFQPTLHLVAIVTTLTAGRMGTPDQMLLLFPWLAWLAAWLARKRHAAAVLALVALLVLPWFVFVYTLQGNTEHLVVTLALPFLTLAVFVGKEFATVRCKRRSPSASLRVNSAESRGSPWRTRLRILRSVAHYEHALVHIVRGLTLAILLAAFALRVYHLNERSIWYDEAFSVFLAEQDFGEIVRGTAADIQPPLYYFLLHIWQGLGTEPFVMRFLSVGLSLAGVALVFALTRRLFSQRAAVFAMLFAAILPFQIEYAQELRMYALLELALLVYFYSFVALSQTDRPTLAIVALAISGAAALYSQSLAVLTWIVPDLVVVAQRDWRTLRRLAMAQALSLVLFAPWLVVLSGQMAQVQQAYWTTPPGLANVLQLLIAFTTHQPLPAWFLPAALFVTLVVDVILALEIARAFRRGASPELGITLAFAALPPLAMIVLSFVMRSIFVVRAVILSSLAFAMLLGWLMARLRAPRAQLSAAILGLAVVAVPLAFQYGYYDFPRSPFRAADAFLRGHARPGDLIVHDNKLSFFPMRYYDRTLPQAWLADPAQAGSNTLAVETQQVLDVPATTWQDAAPARGRVWFVIFQRAIDEAAARGERQANLKWLDKRYGLVSEERFGDLNVLLYQN